MSQNNPFTRFKTWYDEEGKKQDIINLTSVGLATVSKDGRPHNRIVLFKSFKDNCFQFYTNYDSDKGQEIEHCPYVAMNFHWRDSERQIRIEGKVEKTSREDSEQYWNSRPRASQLSGTLSQQSREIESFEWLKNKYKEIENEFKDKEVPCPKNWGGYRLCPDRIEFWQGLPDRLHQRTLFRLIDQQWHRSTLSP